MSNKGKSKQRVRTKKGKEKLTPRRKKRKVNYSTYKETKKQRNIAIMLIPIMAFSIIIIAIILAKDVNLKISNNLNPVESDQIQIVYQYNGEEQVLKPGENIQKIPKTAILKEIRIQKNFTSIYQNTTHINSVKKNITYESEEKSYNNLLAEEFKREHEYMKIKNKHINILHIYDSFNTSYSQIINLTYSIDVIVDQDGVETNLSFWDFQGNGFDILYTSINNFTRIQTITLAPVVYINSSSYNNTYMKIVAINSPIHLTNFSLEVNLNISGYFYDEEPESYFSVEESITFNSELDQTFKINYEENKYIISDIITLNITLSLGLWIFNNFTKINNTVIIEDLTLIFVFVNPDLFYSSAFGLLLGEIDINNIDWEDQHLDYTVKFEQLAIF